jgi:4-hydroxy-3-methylbut-2-enyl diphosphate reductase
MGQLPEGAVILVENVEDVARLIPPESGKLAWASQTTLSVDDTREIVAALVARFPDIVGPHKDDICYATTNRQDAVKAVAPQVEAMIVVGAPNSSNSLRLREVAELAGCRVSLLLQRASDLDFALLNGVTRLGITAGASAPEVLVDEIIDALRARFDVTIETVTNAVENVHFPAPRELRVRGQLS